MSVASQNPFAFLDEESEPRPAAAQQDKETNPQKTETASNRGAQKGRTGPASRGGRYYQRGGGTKAPSREGQDGEDAPREEKQNGDGGRGRGRGRGRSDRGRGDRGGRGRPFDRHSQTGKTDSGKQVHQGWGGDEGKTELKAEEEALKDAAAAQTPITNDWATDGAVAADDAWGVPPAPAAGDAQGQDAAASAADTRRQREREEEEDNTLTLEQYLAQQKEKSSVPKLEEAAREANEGKDVFKGSMLHTKDEEEPYFVGKTKGAPKQRSKSDKEKQTIAFEGYFPEPSRGGRGRGRGGERGPDRGGDRGDRVERVDRGDRGDGRARGRGGARGGDRGGRGGRGRPAGNGVANLDVDDQSAFPSLA